MDHIRDSGDKTDDPRDLLIMASFLAFPIATLLWSIACFTIAIAAYCVQGTDKFGGVLLLVVLGVVFVVGGASIALFSRTWNLARREEEEQKNFGPEGRRQV